MVDRDHRLAQARAIGARGDFTVAYTIYESLLRAYPDDPAVLRAYGRAKYQEYDDLEQAAALFARAHAAAPESVEGVLWLADLAALGYGPGYEQAAALYRQALRLDPEAVDAYLGLGMLHRVPGRPIVLDEALAAFRRAAQLDRLERDEPVTSTVYTLDSPRYR